MNYYTLNGAIGKNYIQIKTFLKSATQFPNFSHFGKKRTENLKKPYWLEKKLLEF